MPVNTNPIKYSDLISPDNSIADLIKQLDELSEAYKSILKNTSGNPIKYSSLVNKDNAISDLIKQLDELGDAYKNTLKNINSEAINLKASLQNVSGATSSSRKTIRAAASDADKLVKAKQALAEAESKNAEKLALIRKATAEANQMSKLAAKLKDTEAGSYNALSAQYSINKIALNNMSAAYRQNTKEGRDLEKETRAIYEEMKKLQSVTGMNQLNVGNYSDATKNFTNISEGVSSYSDKLKTALGINNDFGNSLISLGNSTQGAKGLFSALSDGAVALGRTLFGLLKNPVFLAISGITAVGAAFKFWYDYNKGLVEATNLTNTFTGKTGDDLKEYRSEVQAIADIYNKDFRDVLESANALAKRFGISQDEALNLIKDGFVSGADATGKFLNLVKEYPAHFKDAGISAKQFIAIASQSPKDGVFSDKGIEAIKSANARIRQMSKNTAYSLEGIGISYIDVQKKMQEGSLTTFEVMKMVSQKLNEFPENSAVVGQAIVGVFGGAGKDAGLEYLKTLKDIDLNLDKVKESAGKLGALQEEQLQSQIELSNNLSALFDRTGGSFEEMTTKAKIFVNKGLAEVIKSVIDLINYGVRLYNDSVAFRTIIQATISAVKSLLSALKSVFTFAMSSLKLMGQALHGVFTLNWDEITNAFDKWGKNMKKIALDTAVSVASSIQKGIANTSKKIEPITIPVKAGNITNTGLSDKIKPSKEGKIADYSKKERPKKISSSNKDLEAIQKNNLNIQRKYEDALAELIDNEFDKRQVKTRLNYTRQIEDLKKQLETEKNISVESKKTINNTIEALEKQLTKNLSIIENDRNLYILNTQKEGLQIRLEAVKKGSEEEQKIRLEMLEKEKNIALLNNASKSEEYRQNENDIISGFEAKASNLADEYIQAQLRIFDAQQALAQSEFDLLRNSEDKKTRFRLKAEKDRLLKVLELNEKMGNKLSDIEVSTIKNVISKIDQEINQSRLDERSKGIYGLLGLNLDDRARSSISDSTNFAIEQLNAVLNAKIETANKALDIASREVEASKSRVESELEARNNGYANNVLLAQKELDNSRKIQEQAKREKEKAVKQQQALDTITQSSSLITASANIWASLSSIPIIGPALASAAVGVMWSSFAASKIKAMQAVKSDTEKYSSGTVELLKGGSHQSGNDVDLGTKQDGTRRRAEGGEFFAVINKRSSKKYRSLIPEVINSLNNDSFENKYMNIYSEADNFQFNSAESQINSAELKEIAFGVTHIKNQNQRKFYKDAEGNTIEIYKNLKRIKK